MQTAKLPAGPQTPQWLQKLEWIMRPLEFMENCAEEYGEIFTARFGPKSTPVVFISHPEAIKQIFTTDPKKLDAGKGNGMKLNLLREQSLISLDGEVHQSQRKLLTPPFHGERMRTYGQMISEITEQETNRWPAKKSVNILHSMQVIALQAIVQAVLEIITLEAKNFNKFLQKDCK
ncbi:cytochrome P450 [Ancylothrix sp. C2]|uniref:cytochrome P450 n=1 Tax=Ancylothrix sp. D3o TaxID=2953691 RepID=UPI0021BB34E3|nr:cytochrome P450 [Ancylothrix sp. D3o]MCT7951910.1 cytochrome P450 [Ancylothrix sp. D3o]